ncbi:MAG: Holliday junction resolvase RuvX [Cyclobacteriaceae bacterium]
MGRVLAIDYGLKRTGLAVTDPLRIIATALTTVETSQLLAYLKSYFGKEQVDEVIIGLPRQLNNRESDIAPAVRRFMDRFEKTFPGKPLRAVDERFTSAIAQRAMIEGGMKKKNRRVKENVDMISATIILQSYMESIR